MPEAVPVEPSVPSQETVLAEQDPLFSPRWQIILLQILFAIVWSYQLLFSQDSNLSEEGQHWVILLLLLSVGALYMVPARWFESFWVPTALVLGDTIVTSGLIYLSGNGETDVYLTYFLIMLIAVTARTLKQVVVFSLVVCAAYGGALYLEFLHTSVALAGHFLRLPLFLIMALFYGVNAERLRAVSAEKSGLVDHLAERERLLAELQAALADVKKLSGLLPICAHCKSVRDDQGYWKTVEEFMRTHAGSDFSHGICPRCLDKHFPDYPEAKAPESVSPEEAKL